MDDLKTTGGAAFPLQYDPFVVHPVHGRIHRAALGEDIQEGMTLRDYFAAKAMQGMLSAPRGKFGHRTGAAAVEDAYAIADAMLKERDK